VDLDKGDITNRRELKSLYRPEEIIEKISLILNVSKDRIINGESRAIAIYLMKKYTSLTNKEIGNIFGNLSYSGVSKVSRRFEKKIEKDSSLKRKIMAIMSNVKG
jgi:chromosomal replication initiation ATPase DnaA